MLILKQALQAGQTLVGTWQNGASPAQVETIGHAGFDFVVLDTEHSSFGIEETENLVRAADAANLPALVRVWDNRPRLVGKTLDYGTQGVIIPHVGTAEEAQQAVDHAFYAPLGSRGAAPNVRGARYGHTRWPDYLAQAMAETLLVLQIEGQEGLSNLDAIMAVKGVDVLFVGPFDLSESLGISGQLDHPLLLDTVSDIVRRARENNIALGIWMPSPEQLGPWIERGVQLLTVANNDLIFFKACQDFASRVKKQISNR